MSAGRLFAACLSLAAGACAAAPTAPEPPAPATPLPAPASTSVATGTPATPLPAALVLTGELTQGGYARGKAPAAIRTLTLDGISVALADDGAFLLAFDRDAPATARLVATAADGRSLTQTIAIAPRDWRIERVDVARAPGGASAAFLARREPELARIAAARSKVTDAAGWRQDFIWPARGRLSGLFGSQRIYRGGEAGSYHSGLDIAGGAGATYVAPADGVVVLATQTEFSLEGRLLIVDHGNGLSSAFLHSDRLLVEEGAAVRQGQPLGTIGMTGRATGPHLHWGLVWQGRRLDPLLFTGPMD